MSNKAVNISIVVLAVILGILMFCELMFPLSGTKLLHAIIG